MIDVIIALLLGYWLGKKEDTKQKDQEYTGSIKYNSMDYGYVRDGESIKDLT